MHSTEDPTLRYPKCPKDSPSPFCSKAWMRLPDNFPKINDPAEDGPSDLHGITATVERNPLSQTPRPLAYCGNLWFLVSICFYLISSIPRTISADPASPWPRQGGAWDHRRCGTLLSLKATVNCTTALTCFGLPKLTDASLRPQTLPPLRLALAWFRLAPRLVLWGFGWHPVWLYGISAGPLSGFMGFQNWRMAPCPDLKPSPRPRAPWIELRRALAWFRLAPCLILWAFQNWRMAPCPDLKPLPTPNSSLDWAAAGFSMVSAATLSGCMGFRLAPCLVIWDFGWPSVWFYGISKLTDGPLPRSQTPPHAQELLGLSCGGLTASDLLWASKTDGCIAPPSNPSSSAAGFSMVSAGTPSGFMGFRLAPCLVIWDFGWPSVWFYGISKLTDGPLSRFGWPPV